MAKRKPPQPSPDAIHAEMLEHLERHPPKAPAAEKAKPVAAPRKPRSAPARPPRRPRIMLRHLPRDLALDRLETFLRACRQAGDLEVVVVVGKGRGSPDGRSILRPAVEQWCRQRPALVRRFEPATPREGGDGALIAYLSE